MKKMNVLLAALTLAATAITPMTSSAATDYTSEKKVEVSVTFPETYTFCIPETSEVEDGTPMIIIEVKDVYVEVGHGVKVTVSGESYKNGSWKLKSDYDEIGYKIENYDGTTRYENGDTVQFSAYETTTHLYIRTDGRPVCPGTYSDTLTFTSEITGYAA